jgi:DNA-binding transcriptional regulator LsrR (DeoR family)
VLDEQQAGDLDYLYNQRIKADYYEDDVTLEEARAALKVSEALVHRLLEEQP